MSNSLQTRAALAQQPPSGSHLPTCLTIDTHPRVHGLAVEVDHHGIHEHRHGFSPLPGYEGDASQAGDIALDRDGAANPQVRVISAEALGVTIPMDEGLQGMGLGSCAVLVRVEARTANAVALAEGPDRWCLFRTDTFPIHKARKTAFRA